VKFDDNNLDMSRVDDRRDGSGRTGSPMGSSRGGDPTGGLLAMLLAGKLGKGGAGLVLVLGALLLFAMCSQGGSPTTQLPLDSSYNAPAGAEGVSTSLAQKCTEDAADGVFENTDCLLVKSFNETDEVWSGYFASTGQKFREPQLTFFDGQTRTACGAADTSVGPFYCPGDERIYFDLGFSRDLERLGVQGQYAMVYIMAHEYGHHLQNISGIERQVRKAQSANRRNANNYSVAMELQADCLAGAWGRMANDQGNVVITPEEFTQATNAAAAVGDDRIQSGSGMRVNPDTFTHGSAKQRTFWYTRGYEQGTPGACNTFKELGLPL
jgi:predicted metalloprotease